MPEISRFFGISIAMFAEVKVNPELGTLCWPNGADLDPDVLYAKVSGEPIHLSTPDAGDIEPGSLAPVGSRVPVNTLGLVTSLFGTPQCRVYQRHRQR